MGFQINRRKDPKYRNRMTSRDLDYAKNCRTCPVAQLCGPAWSVWNDARWCDGPGAVCFDGCRAICSRAPDKVDFYARNLGEGNYFYDSNNPDDDQAKPILDITGQRHPWKPWKMDWPDVGFQLNAHAGGVYQPMYTLSLKHLYYHKRDTWSQQRDLRARYQIPEESILGITMTCQDELMDMIELDRDRLAAELAQYEGVDYVFVPNFSVYDNYPRLDQLFRIKFKWLAMDKLQEAGLRVVPDICFITTNDFKNQAAWMRESGCDVMLMNFQVQAVPVDTKEWRAVVRGAVAMQEHIGRPVRLIAYGAAGEDRIKSLLEAYGPNITFIDAKSYRLAEFHKDLDENVDKSIDVREQAHANFFEQRRRIAAIKGLPTTFDDTKAVKPEIVDLA